MGKVIQIEKGYYNSISSINIEVDENIKWFQNDIVASSGLHKNFCNYWTVVDKETFKEYFAIQPFSSIEWLDKYIIFINDVKPTDKLKKVDSIDELLTILDLENVVVMDFDEQYNVTNVSKVRNILHPTHADLDVVSFCKNDKICVRQIRDTIYSYKGFRKTKVVADTMGIWKNCMGYVLDSISGENKNRCNLIWKHNQMPPNLSELIDCVICEYDSDKSAKLDFSKAITPDVVIKYKAYSKAVDTLLAQFGLTVNDF